MTPPDDTPRRDTATLVVVALCLVIAAAAWFLLQQLAMLLRPLLLAVFLAYIILPAHRRLTQHLPGYVSFLVLAVGSLGILYFLTWVVYTSAAELGEDQERYLANFQVVFNEIGEFWHQHMAWYTAGDGDGTGRGGAEVQQLRALVKWGVNAAREALTEALVVGFYLLFLLLEAHKYPLRVRTGFAGERAAQILDVARRINDAIANYIKAKVQASVLLAVPVTIVLAVCQVRFPLLWGILTFLCNFIPYLGSIAAVSLPLAFAFLDVYPEPGWQPFAAAAGVLAVHLVMTYLVEPQITSRAVGLSPLVILFSLAFWGQCWGLIGMFLAVPLTVVVKIVLENVAFTRPFAELLGDHVGEHGEPGAKHGEPGAKHGEPGASAPGGVGPVAETPSGS
jgi:AI-2 transport protein TqsA